MSIDTSAPVLADLAGDLETILGFLAQFSDESMPLYSAEQATMAEAVADLLRGALDTATGQIEVIVRNRTGATLQ